jgi:hypothetical protein
LRGELATAQQHAEDAAAQASRAVACLHMSCICRCLGGCGNIAAHCMAASV